MNNNISSKVDGDVKIIFDHVLPKILDIIGERKLNSSLIRPLLIEIIKVIQNYTKEKYDHIDGSEKKEIALSVLDYIIKYLRDNDKINDNVADAILLSLDILGPSIIDFASAFVKKIVLVSNDIAKKGCTGCFKRNFKRNLK